MYKLLSPIFLWMEAFVNLAVTIVPVSTENEDISVVPDNRRACIACVSGKLSDNQDLTITAGLVIIDIVSPTITA